MSRQWHTTWMGTMIVLATGSLLPAQTQPATTSRPAHVPMTMPVVTAPELPAQDVAPGELLHPSAGLGVPVIGPLGIAQPIVVTDRAVNRGQAVKGQFILPWVAKGNEQVKVHAMIADSLGRVILDEDLPAAACVPAQGQLANSPPRAVPFELTPTNVIAMRHYLTLSATSPEGKTVSATGSFIVRPPTQWDDYVLAIWQKPDSKRMALLPNVHISGSEYSGGAVGVPEDMIDANFRYYIEGTGNWVFSAYHHYFGDWRPNNYEYFVVKQLLREQPKNMQLLVRDPCLSDPVIRQRIRVQFQQVASQEREYSPYYYSIADEAGIADQAAPFDFCFSRFCQDRYRVWLKQRYGSLDALNSEWQTSFTDWNEVHGVTTDQMFARSGENYSAWCDFKDFMDSVQVDAYNVAKEGMRTGDPSGRLGMGGAQGPNAVGCWDYWKLTRVMDLIEPYCIGNDFEVIRSFAPKCILIHTSFANEKNKDPDQRLSWYLWMLEDKGQWIWDEKRDLIDANGIPSAVGKSYVPQWRALTAGSGMLRIASQRADEPVAIYESQANLRVHWVLENKADAKEWLGRTSRTERVENRYMRLRDSWLTLLEDNGFQSRFMAPQQAKDELVPFDAKTGTGTRVLILPQMYAMSQEEAVAITKFVHDGGVVLADGMPGTYDEHGKKLAKPLLEDLFADNANTGKGKAILLKQQMQDYYNLRMRPDNAEVATRDQVAALVRQGLGDATNATQVLSEDGKPITGILKTLWHNGDVEMVGLVHNPEFRVNELGEQEYRSNKKFEETNTVLVRSATDRVWYDVLTGKQIGAGKEVKVAVPPFGAVILTSYPAAAGPFDAKIDVPAGKINITPAANCPLATAVYHLDFVGPDGVEREMYRQNVKFDPKGGAVQLPLALNDQPGSWTLRVTEVATGNAVEAKFDWRK